MKLLCIPPTKVRDFLPIVRRHLEAAVERAGLVDFAPVLATLTEGRSLLWVAAGEDNHIRGAGITELIQEPAGKICVVVAWGSEAGVAWKPCLRVIEEFAQDEKCAAVRLYGRPGWLRRLPEYRLKAVVMERPL